MDERDGAGLVIREKRPDTLADGDGRCCNVPTIALDNFEFDKGYRGDPDKRVEN
jgi:hypothetical protein